MKADGLLGCLINKLIDMKRIAFILLFLSSLSVYGQETWNTCSQTVTVIPQPSYDSTFVLSAPSRAALAKGMASWTASSSSSASYLVYTALLTQASTDDPVPTVLENTLGGTVVWTRSGVGLYLATLSGAFTSNKTFFIVHSYAWDGANNNYLEWVSSNQVRLQIGAGDGFLDSTYPCMLEIRVYP